MIAGEGLVHEVKPGKYTHEVKMHVGEGRMEMYTRAEEVYAFTEIVKEPRW